MICQNCHKNIATVTVIEIPPGSTKAPGESTPPPPQQQELCEICAQSKNLPHAPLEKKLLGDIWKLLQATGQTGETTAQSPQQSISCPDCGMTREEFRRKGRVGCAKDYEVFADDVREIIERVHGATRHAGRAPGGDPEKKDRMKEIHSLQRELKTAIREEDYENAARIRDRLSELDATPRPEPQGTPKSASEKHLE